MQFSAELREAVASGGITVSIRLWRRPQVKRGGRYATAGVLIEIDALDMLPFAAVTADDVRQSGEHDRESLRARAAHAGPIGDDTLIYRVEFHVVDQPAPRAGPRLPCMTEGRPDDPVAQPGHYGQQPGETRLRRASFSAYWVW